MMRKRLFACIVCLTFIRILLPAKVWSRIGVGVGTGKIVVEDKLRPGMIYELPSLTVLNTGDEEGDYEAAVTYHEKQKELQPAEKWFAFSPDKFHLKPGGSQEVKIKLNLPVKTVPGEYFAYLEGHPVKKAKEGQTSIGVAAAAKLYFTVVPANLVLGIYYRAASFWKINQPWTGRVAVLLMIIIVYRLLNKFLGFRVGFGKKKVEEEEKEENE